MLTVCCRAVPLPALAPVVRDETPHAFLLLLALPPRFVLSTLLLCRCQGCSCLFILHLQLALPNSITLLLPSSLHHEFDPGCGGLLVSLGGSFLALSGDLGIPRSTAFLVCLHLSLQHSLLVLSGHFSTLDSLCLRFQMPVQVSLDGGAHCTGGHLTHRVLLGSDVHLRQH